MKRKICVMISYVMVTIILMMTIGAKEAKADASGTISVSSATVEVGKSATVTVTVGANVEIEMYQFNLVFDSNLLSYESGDQDAVVSGNTIRVVNYDKNKKSFSFKFSTKAVGTASLSFSGVVLCPTDMANGDSIPTGISNGSITITAPYEASHNAELASLSIGEAKISPAFSKDVTQYTASVAGTVGKVTVSAKAEDGKAKVAVSGNTNLKEGANTVSVVVTAEDGTTKKTYTITVTRAKPPTPKPASPTPTPTPPVFVKVGESDLTIKNKPSEEYMENTEEWEVSVVEYKNYKVGALVNKENGMTVVELSDGNLYMFDTEKGTATRYQSLMSPQQNLIILDVGDDVIIPMGYQKTTRNLDDMQITAFVTSEDSEYALVYAKNNKGFTGWFEWDITNGTFQRFNTEQVELNPTPTPTATPIPTSTSTPTPTVTILPTPTEAPKEASTSSSFMNKVLMGTSGVLFILSVVFLVLFLVQKSRYNTRYSIDPEASDDEDYL